MRSDDQADGGHTILIYEPASSRYRAFVRIDLNADVGEGYGVWTTGADEALLDVVTSANVACGFHAGDPLIMWRTCASAARRGVRVGAQVGYRDLAGFGRRRMEIPADALTADVVYQIGALQACAGAVGTRVGYVKPHGALYNTAADDPGQADAVVAAVAAVDSTLPVLGPAGSELADAAARYGVPFVAEAFADRGYLASGRLVPRERPDALVTDPSTVAARAVRFVTDKRLTAVDGTEIDIEAASICVHGDTPGAAELARVVRNALLSAGIAVEPFTA